MTSDRNGEAPYRGAVALIVHDYDRARDWYRQALGWRVERDDVLERSATGQTAKRWLLMVPAVDTASGPPLLLARAVNAEQRAVTGRQGGGRVWLFFQTEHFERDHRRLLAAGAVLEAPPRSEPYGTVVVFQDLYGNRCDLIEPRRLEQG